MGDVAAADIEEVEVDVIPPAKPTRQSTRAKLQRGAASAKDLAKKNPKKAAVSCCCIWSTIIVVIILIAGAVAGFLFARQFFFGGDARSAAVGGAAMAQGERKSLIPAKEGTAEAATNRRRMLVNEIGPLAQCPRDSQVVVDAEATPTSVFDGTTIFQTVDMIQCLMRQTKPGNSLTINRGEYAAVINENICTPSDGESGGGGGGGLSGGQGGGGSSRTVSLRTVAVNATRPTLEEPNKPFGVKLVLPIKAPKPPTAGPTAGQGSSSSQTSQSSSVDHDICFDFIGWVFNNVTNSFTDYELTFASCDPPDTSSQTDPSSQTGGEFAIEGRIQVSPPDNSVDLTQLHTLIPGHADKQIDPTNWTDLKFYMKVNEPYGETTVQGRTVYEREAAVGCAKASEPSGPVEICFDAETVLTNKTDYVLVTDGQASSTQPSVSVRRNLQQDMRQQGRQQQGLQQALSLAIPRNTKLQTLAHRKLQGQARRTLQSSEGDGSSTAGSDGDNQQFRQVKTSTCKSRTAIFTLSEVQQYRAYKLCDDDKCSGKHDCQESGPTNSVNIYQCKEGTDTGGAGCDYDQRSQNGYIFVYDATRGAEIYVYGAYGGPEDASPPPPPPSPPPEQVTAYIPPFPDGTQVWKEDYGGDDKLYTVRRSSGTLTRVTQNQIRLCDMPGTYTIGNSKSVAVSYEQTTAGECPGSLKIRNGVDVGPVFTVSREHVDRDLSPEKAQYALLTNGQAGGAAYRLPISTEYWQVVKLEQAGNWPQQSRPDKYFRNDAVPKGSSLTATSWSWVDGTYTQQTHTMTVAATTYQIVVEQDYEEMLAYEKAVIAADAECQLTADATAEQYWALPPKCTRLECTTIDGTGCGTRGYGTAKESCTAHSAYGCYTYYPRQATGFQKLRAAPAGSATLGNIVAESLVQIYRESTLRFGTYSEQRNNITYLIQCMEAAAGSDLTDARATTFTPKDTGTTAHCGLAEGEWLRGPEDHGYVHDDQNALLGKILAVQKPQAVVVTTTTLLPNWASLTLSGGYTDGATGAGANIDLSGTDFVHQRSDSFAGKVTAQPTGESLVNYTLREAVKPGESIHGLKCLHNCINPSLVGTSETPPTSKNVVHNYKCPSNGDCNAPDISDVQKVLINHTFDEYSWSSNGLNFCGSSAESSSGDVLLPSQYQPNDCTQPVAIPQGTTCELICYGSGDSKSCRCNDWEIKTTLFTGATANDFLCSATGQSSGSSSSAASATNQDYACLTKSDGTWSASATPNVDDLDVYYEYRTGVKTEWQSADTIWLESVETTPQVLQIESPLLLTLQVPSNGPVPSLSGIDYSGKKLVATYSDGIDRWNSPSFPLWCVNRQTGLTKAPTTNSWGMPECMDWTRVSAPGFNWEQDFYEAYPDVNPDLTWDTFDGKTLRWGLKPAEKTVIYSKIGSGNCTKVEKIVNPVSLEEDWKIPELLRQPVEKMRANIAELRKWFAANKAKKSAIRVNTGKFVNVANATR